VTDGANNSISSAYIMILVLILIKVLVGMCWVVGNWGWLGFWKCYVTFFNCNGKRHLSCHKPSLIRLLAARASQQTLHLIWFSTQHCAFPSFSWSSSHCWLRYLSCKNRFRNDLLFVRWDSKPYSLTYSLLTLCCSALNYFFLQSVQQNL